MIDHDDDFAPHISESDVHPEQVVLVEGDDGEWEETTISTLLEKEADDEKDIGSL